MTPFEVVYGYPPPTILTYLPGSSPVHLVDTSLRDRDALLRRLKENLQLKNECGKIPLPNVLSVSFRLVIGSSFVSSHIARLL